MFAQVACGKCGKPFQVPQGQLGQPVACPWCRETGAPLPVVGVVPEALPDDAPPLPAPRRKRPWRSVVAVTLLSLLVLVVAYFASAYYCGRVPSFVWQRFTAADGTCRIDLPGGVTEEVLPAWDHTELRLTRPGKLFTTNSSFTYITGFVGWYDLDPAAILRTDVERVLSHEVSRRTVWRSIGQSREEPAETVPVKVGAFSGHEVRFVRGQYKYAERYVVVSQGPHPRLYVFGISGGDRFDLHSEAAKRVLSSFWFDETK